MRSLDPDVVAGLQTGRFARRNLIWITAKDRSTGDPHSAGFWNGEETVGIPVIDADTGSSVTRTFKATGGLISLGPVVLTADLTIRTAEARLSPLNSDANQYLRGYDLRLAPIQWYRAIFDLETWELVAEGFARFVGFVEKAPITTPAAGGDAEAVLSCVSHTAELTRANPDVRSHQSQQRRGGDGFYRYVDTMADRTVWWGQNPPQGAS